MKHAKPNSQPRHIAWKTPSINALKPEPARYIAWSKDASGKGVRVFPRGWKSFILAYRFEGRSRMLTLGRYPTLSLASAGRRYADAERLLEKGEDPGVKVVAEKKAERGAATVAELAQQYIAHIQSPESPKKSLAPRKRSWREDRRIIEKDLIPALGSWKAKDVGRADLRALIRDINARGAPIMANRTLACVRRLFNWAVSEDLIPASPAVAIEAPGKEEARDRALDEAEIQAFWTRLDETDLPESTRSALRLILATAQRPGEVAGAEWSDIDLQNGWWEIPRSKTKNDRAHSVPLNGVAIQILKRLEKLNGADGWLFPTRMGKQLRVDSLSKAIGNNRRVFGIDHFTPHDLRRTAATRMTAAGVPRDTVGKILNHTELGVTAKTYDRYGYAKEKVAAMRKWGRHLERAIAGQTATNVVSFAS
jgi:integrase